MFRKISDVLLSLLFGMIGGIGIYCYMTWNQPEPAPVLPISIVTVDIRKLIDAEKDKIMNADDVAAELEKVSQIFSSAIEKTSNGKIVLVKDAVITGARDITDEIRKSLQKQGS